MCSLGPSKNTLRVQECPNTDRTRADKQQWEHPSAGCNKVGKECQHDQRAYGPVGKPHLLYASRTARPSVARTCLTGETRPSHSLRIFGNSAGRGATQTRLVCEQSSIAFLCPSPALLLGRALCAPARLFGRPSPTPGHPAFWFDPSDCGAPFGLAKLSPDA